MNRSALLLLVVTLIVSLVGVSGCGGGTTETTTSQTTNSSAVSSPANSSSSNPITGDIWSDIPVYPNAQQAADEGFGLSMGGDPSFSKIEWRFFAASAEMAKVVDFYNTQMQSKGWTKDFFVDSPQMSYGSYSKNNKTRNCLIYILESEGKIGLNIMSAAK